MKRSEKAFENPLSCRKKVLSIFRSGNLVALGFNKPDLPESILYTKHFALFFFFVVLRKCKFVVSWTKIPAEISVKFTKLSDR